jgi:hypothetical protein
MPTVIFAIPNKNILYVRCYGHLKPKDLMDWKVEAQISQTGRMGFITVVDLSGFSSTDMTFEDINAIYGKLVRHYEPRNQKLNLHLFAPDDLPFGMTRIMQSLTGMTPHVEVHIFRNEDSLQAALPQLEKSISALSQDAARHENK